MFDDLDSRLNCLADGFGRVGVHGDVSAPVASRLRRRTQLGRCEGHHVQRTVG